MGTEIINASGDLVAAANRCVTAEIPGERSWEGTCIIKCYFFNRVHLSPPILFEHLAGTGLSRFFNDTQVFSDGEAISKRLRYVHGKSEVMKGRSYISSVLLARPEPEGGVSDQAWLSYLPDIYKKFLATRTRS